MHENSKIAHYSLDKTRKQEIKEHSMHVAMEAEMFGNNISIKNCCYLVGILHDIGKYSKEFQEYINITQEEDLINSQKAKHIDHGKYGAKMILTLFHTKDNSLMGKVTAEILALTICYHHGGLPNCIERDLQIRLLERIKEDDNIYQYVTGFCYQELISENDLQERFSNACGEISLIFQSIKSVFKNDSEQRFQLHLFIKYVYSCLIDADRCDTRNFMNPTDSVKKVGKNNWINVSNTLNKYVRNLSEGTKCSEKEDKVKELRNYVWQKCNSKDLLSTKIYRLTVPTGGGKTLSSFRFALNQILEDNLKKDKIIYILPYTTIIEQNAAIIRDIVNGEVELLEHHCNINMDESIEQYEIVYRELLVDSWDCPIIFSTMVQFLDIFYAKGTQSIRRLHNLSNSIIVFDEIQSLPSKCISLFNEAVNFLNNMCNTTIVLCSATQPNLDRIEHSLFNVEEIIDNTEELFNRFKRMNVQKIDNELSFNELMQFAVERYNEEGSLLIIMNTKEMTSQIYKSFIRDKDLRNKVFYLSTNLCPEHRKNIIAEIKQKLRNKERIICVSTALIEAGVDISFDVVIRHIAGMDSIAQASGRGNRNGEKLIGNTYIVDCYEERLDGLKEIELREKCTKYLLNDYELNSDIFSKDLLSPKSINQYFNYLYLELSENKKMDYNIVNGETLFHLLSNTGLHGSYKLTKGMKCPMQIDYAFEDAANNFNVIDELTQSILVPFGKGKELIADIMSDIYIPISKKKLRSMQMYMVNCYTNQLKKIDINNGIMLIKDGIYILKDGFYDEYLGVVEEGGAMLSTISL